MPRPKKREYVFAVDTTSVAEHGHNRYRTTVRRGQVWHAGCDLVKSHPELFSPDPPDVFPVDWEPPVEQATAAPGEKRNSGR